MKIDKENNINLLKNKVSIDDLLQTQKDDLKILESFKIDKLYLRISKEQAVSYAHILYPLLSINYLSNKIDYNITNEFKLYIKMSFNLSNILFKLVKIRRLKNERTSN